MRGRTLTGAVLVLAGACAVSGYAATGGANAADYPLSLTLNAKVKSGDTEITSIVTVTVDRLMEESRRTRVTDALRYNGYQGFLNTLRTLPAVGKIEVQKRSVAIRYAVEQPDDKGRRLTLVSDRPLVFINAERTRNTEGYELTVVELRLDGAGGASGTMAGAARVKPSPDGVVLYDFNEAAIQLETRKPR